MPKKAFHAVLFDLDGTLLDTLQDIAVAANAVLKRYGYPVHSREKYRYFVGDGSETLMYRALPENFRDTETIKALTREYYQEYQLRWMDSSKPYPQVTELLQELKKRELITAVLSNKMHTATCQMVQSFLPGHNFSLVQGVSHDLAPKPDPSGAIMIAGKLGIAEKNWLYLGDTNTDMLTAQAAGMLPVGVLWGFREAEELIQNGAQILLASPLELLAYL